MQRLLDTSVFAEKAGNLYAVLDAARDARVTTFAEQGVGRCLYRGESAIRLKDYAPYLVAIPDHATVSAIMKLFWGRSVGVFLETDEPFDSLWSHLRRFTLVELPNESVAYFRFYDPRVLRTFLPTCSAGQRGEFFGKTTAMYTESYSPDRAWRFEPGGGFESFEV